MDRIPDYLKHVDALIADPLHIARAAASAGTRVVGYIGDGFPVALIAAAGALPLRLRGQAGRATPRADEFMESAFTPVLRTIAEQWLDGELDFLQAVVFSRSDDSSQRLYYYLCELQRRGRCGGPRPLLYDVAGIARSTSVAHSRDSTRRLASELGVEPARLAPALERAASREALLADIRSRSHAEAPLPGALAWRLQFAADQDWRDTFYTATRDWLSNAPAIHPRARVVLAGDSPPDDSLHRTIEAAGASVVLDLTESLPDREVVGRAEIDALADRTQARLNPVRAMRENPAWIAERAADARADAVVLWLIEEDEALPWEISRQMRALRLRRLPALLLTRQPWKIDEAARRAVNEFLSREVTR